MLFVYVPRGNSLERSVVEESAAIPDGAVWFDLVSPTLAEDKMLERTLGIAVPTREEMQEIEVSSRLYIENGARYMTATLMCQSDTATPKTTAVTFILAGHRLVTVRYDEPRPFTLITNKLARACPANVNGESIMMDLLDAVIDRAADILERAAADIDRVSHDIFEPEGRRVDRTKTYRYILRTIGRKGDLTSKVRESLVSIGRLVLFLANEADGLKWPKEMRSQLENDAARRAVPLRPRKLPRQQGHLPARRDARRHERRAEQHHQDFLDCGCRAAAADAGRHNLRHELQEYAGAQLGIRIPNGDLF